MSVRQRLHRPTGIRNGGLLLVLTALALVMALVDTPLEPGRGPRPPGVFQFLPPPIGIAQPPPAVVAPAQPPAAAGEALERGRRRHPLRQQPRPVQPRRPDGRGMGSASRPASRVTGPGAPPATRPAPALEAGGPVRAQVPAVDVRVTPPRLAGSQPEVRLRTPEVRAELAAAASLPAP